MYIGAIFSYRMIFYKEVSVMELYVDLEKSTLNTSKLVRKLVTVHKKDGKQYSREQWVDPLTGQPVDKKQSKPNEVDRWSTGSEKATPNNKQVPYPDLELHNPTGSVVKPKSILKDKAKMKPVEYDKHEGVDRIKPFIDNDVSDFADMESEEYRPLVSIKPIHPPVSIKRLDTGLPDEEIKKRCGEIGSLNLRKLSKGTPIEDAFEEYLKASEDLMNGYGYTSGKNISAIKHFKSIFGNTTKEGLEYVFAGDNESGISADLNHVDVYGNSNTGYVTCEIGLDFKDKKGKTVANTIRSAYRDKEGHLHVYCNLLVVDPALQGKGVIKSMYERTNQYWRHLSKGHPTHVCLVANISVGIYAWARKGYDFGTKSELDSARKNLKDFCRYNKMNETEVIKNCGYNKIDDLKHSWQFASLDDGNKYSLKNEYNNDFHGEGHLGKQFMLNGMDHWAGRLLLNAGDESERVSEM
jgi:hypothetical protein